MNLMMKQKLFFLLIFCFSLPFNLHGTFPRLCCCGSCDDGVCEPSPTELIPRQPSSATPRDKPITLASIKDALREVEQADSSTVAFFDIDYTLIEPVDPTFQVRFWGKPGIYNALFEDFSAFQSRNPSWFPMVMKEQQTQLVEPFVAEYIKKLQQKGATVLAISDFPAGSVGEIPDLHDFRRQELLKKGISFDSPSSFDHERLNKLFAELGQKTLLKHGIISSRGQPKGLLINWALREIHPTAKKVLFFDDKQENHTDTIAYVQELKIPLASYLYTAAKIIHEKDVINETAARAQFHYMHQDNRYVSYHEATERVTKEIISINDDVSSSLNTTNETEQELATYNLLDAELRDDF